MSRYENGQPIIDQLIMAAREVGEQQSRKELLEAATSRDWGRLQSWLASKATAASYNDAAAADAANSRAGLEAVLAGGNLGGAVRVIKEAGLKLRYKDAPVPVVMSGRELFEAMRGINKAIPVPGMKEAALKGDSDGVSAALKAWDHGMLRQINEEERAFEHRFQGADPEMGVRRPMDGNFLQRAIVELHQFNQSRILKAVADQNVEGMQEGLRRQTDLESIHGAEMAKAFLVLNTEALVHAVTAGDAPDEAAIDKAVNRAQVYNMYVPAQVVNEHELGESADRIDRALRGPPSAVKRAANFVTKLFSEPPPAIPPEDKPKAAAARAWRSSAP